VKLVDVVDGRKFYTRHGQHLNLGGKESMASKSAGTIESIMKKKVDPISMKWYDDEIINNQDRKHLDIQERPRSDSITTSTVHNVNIVTVTEYPVMIKA
jgi:uncharacterized protein (UPF0276 family)